MDTRKSSKENGIIFHNAVVHTVDDSIPRASVVVSRGSEIVYVGDCIGAARRAAGPGANMLDLGGATMVPGLIDSHMHFLQQGQQLSEMDIYWKSREEVLALVAEQAREKKPGQWIIGRGWNHEAWEEKVWPSRHDLDRVAPDNPVALSRADHHSMWVNSEALRLAGITAASGDPQGGEIHREDSGNPSGILVDTGMFAVWNALPALSDEEILRLYLLAQDEMLALGLTGIGNASQTVRQHGILARACGAGALKLRVYDMLASHTGQDIVWMEEGREPEFAAFGSRLSARAVKIVLDGSLGSRSAWLLGGYADRPGHYGNGRFSDDELRAIITRAADNGFQPCVHAIGDAAVSQAVRVMARVLGEKKYPDPRFRIEHFQIVSPEETRRAVRAGIIPAMQAVHMASDWKMAEARLAPGTLPACYPWRDVLDAGGVIAGGSDAPMDMVNPYYGIYAAVSRRDLQGEPAGGWMPEQKMTRKEALQSYTIWAAYAEFAEARRGSITPGKLADLTVLDRDIMTCPEDAIKDTRAVMTVIGGEIVFER